MVFKTLDIRQWGIVIPLRERNKQGEPHECPSLLQLTLKQQEFELHRSTYMQIFFSSKYYNTTRSTVGWIHGFSTAQRASSPNPLIQGSAVLWENFQAMAQEGGTQVDPNALPELSRWSWESGETKTAGVLKRKYLLQNRTPKICQDSSFSPPPHPKHSTDYWSMCSCVM